MIEFGYRIAQSPTFAGSFEFRAGEVREVRLLVAHPDEEGLLMWLADVVDYLIGQSPVVGLLINGAFEHLVLEPNLAVDLHPVALDQGNVPHLALGVGKARRRLGQVFGIQLLRRLAGQGAFAQLLGRHATDEVAVVGHGGAPPGVET
ncbi:hypothetical protein D9M71_689380 [compost metagenome]